MRADLPPQGAVLRLEPVELPGLDWPAAGGSGPERERWRRDNVARRTYRLLERDGTPVRVGLFVSIGWAEEYAREHGWTVAHVETDSADDQGRLDYAGSSG